MHPHSHNSCTSRITHDPINSRQLILGSAPIEKDILHRTLQNTIGWKSRSLSLR